MYHNIYKKYVSQYSDEPDRLYINHQFGINYIKTLLKNIYNING